MIAYKEMVAGQLLTASAVAYYAAPANTAAAIHAATVNNPTAAAVVCNLYKVPAAGTAGGPNKIATRTVPAGGTVTLFDAVNHKLQPGTQLYADGLGLGLNISGVEYIPE
ncbi:hypothetical protein [Pseudomonas sp. C9-3]|uniref:hypothetical protein n=1 Tax=Pseudomonas sp. C9-3 TaxID=3078264 RepID=UPI0028EA6C2D|nr:hypothetical protein [Pseudomonas sp. C9-3]